MNRIFPVEIMANTKEYHFNKNNPRGLVIYQAILILVLLAIIAMFLVKVDVSVTSSGILRAIQDNNIIKAIVSGNVEEVFIKENEQVERGDVLLKIRADIVDQQNLLLGNQEEELRNQAADLELLIPLLRRDNLKANPELHSSLYQQQYVLFWQRVRSLQNRLAVVQKNYERHAELFDKKMISVAEYEEVSFNYHHVKNELQLIYDEQGAQWQSELNKLKMQTRELSTKLQQSVREREYYTIKAPLSGTVQQLKGLQAGSSIAANEVIAEISPDSGLIAETYVLPKDIGFLSIGTPVKFQVEAFDYNQWGLVDGEVVSISGDIYTDRGQPYFKVRCLLHDYKLHLKNGYEGNLRKGMTLQARFFVTRRTLFQLLYDKADDWLNPHVMNADQTAFL
ncbi:HlyD family efflux transporter periplasmic adaptor subunit [Olivibacter sp. SDN3]|uniref:HlyD family secretion protein n=1 Tax=Olivibacter sp. SDN3 TaxID=2764720 RepID=UPI001651A7D2|nr:HlyD family efflux transporter periplasmic adaptor subunit [Olivibacter sp. SDN3]QNL50729.1 HlyD family efflux transporter periplasmic adaptor subunit [Olivibacter sp. SDN3]